MREKDFIIREFKLADLNSVYELIVDTIDNSYTGVYPKEAIDFFKDYHSKENVFSDWESGFVLVIEFQNKIIGTGTLLDTNIRRVFIDKNFQRQGLGKVIMEQLEAKAKEKYIEVVDLSASLVAKEFYDFLGYHTEAAKSIEVSNNKQLDYFEMTKKI